jgi:hypothetical protein
MEDVTVDRDDIIVENNECIGEDGREEVQENSMYQVFKAVKRSQLLDIENDDEDSEMIVIASSDFTITRASTNGADDIPLPSIDSAGNKSVSISSSKIFEIETSPIASLSLPLSPSLSPASSPSLSPLIYAPPPSKNETDIDVNLNVCDDMIDCVVIEGEFVDASTLHTEIDLVSTKESSSSFTFIPIEEPEESASTETEEI